ncbi:MAG: hypothetical protein F6J93_02640 [Oscillatoria sp. SIO1A7]|nr:hypothetical protein [Oscillatoria sp. SIO1A7]
MPDARCPMPDAQCPMPQCPMPDAQCPIPLFPIPRIQNSKLSAWNWFSSSRFQVRISPALPWGTETII